MLNHPFYSTNTNVYDESFCTAAPTNLNGQNVIVSHEKQRKMYDTLNTSVLGYPNNYANYAPPMQYFSPGNYIRAQKQYIPGGVAFSFNTVSPLSQPPPTVEFTTQRMFQADYPPQPLPQTFNYYSHPNQVSSPGLQQPDLYQRQPYNMIPRTLEEQIAMNAIRTHGLESLDYQQQLAKNPYQLRFHQNTGTSCTSLLDSPTQVPGSQSTPDFGNLSGIMQCGPQSQHMDNFVSCTCKPYTVEEQKLPERMPIQSSDQPVDQVSKNRRQLVLTKPPKQAEGHVADVLNEDVDQSKKKVSFSLDKSAGNIDESEQASLTCSCTLQGERDCEGSNVSNKKSDSFNKKGERISDSGSSSSEVNTSSKKRREVKGERRYKKKRKRRVYSESDSE